MKSLHRLWRRFLKDLPARSRAPRNTRSYCETLEDRRLLTPVSAPGVIVHTTNASSPGSDLYFKVQETGPATAPATTITQMNTNGVQINGIGIQSAQTGYFTSDGMPSVLSTSSDGTQLWVSEETSSGTLPSHAVWGAAPTYQHTSISPTNGPDGIGGGFLIGHFVHSGWDDIATIALAPDGVSAAIYVNPSNGVNGFTGWTSTPWLTLTGVTGISDLRVGNFSKNTSGLDGFFMGVQTSTTDTWDIVSNTGSSFSLTAGPNYIQTPLFGPYEVRFGNFDGSGIGVEPIICYETGRGYNNMHQAVPNYRYWYTFSPGQTTLRQVYGGTDWEESVPHGTQYDERGFQNIRVGDFIPYSATVSADGVYARDRYGVQYVLTSTGGTSWSFVDTVFTGNPFTTGVDNPYQSGYQDNGWQDYYLGVYAGNFLASAPGSNTQILWIQTSTSSGIDLTTFSGVYGTATLTWYNTTPTTYPQRWQNYSMDGGLWYDGEEGYVLY